VSVQAGCLVINDSSLIRNKTWRTYRL